MQKINIMKQNEEEKWARESKKIRWYQYLALQLFLFVIEYFGFMIVFQKTWEEIRPKSEQNKILVIILIAFYFLNHLINILVFWEHKKALIKQAEIETQTELQKTSEKHKKEKQELKTELIETKTELLLTQNKLRELKEKDEENKN